MLILYTLPLVFILLYSLAQLHLIYLFWKDRKQRKKNHSSIDEDLPFVTIQLPVFNERYVIERLLEAVAKLDWDYAKLEIQVLDDSTDETTNLIDQALAQIRRKGINIKHIRRPSREGFKAGALAYGLERAQGTFIAIFDADFLPKSNFLKQTIPHFDHPQVGVVQTRWTHLNADHSLLTEMQALALDAHFSVEQAGRYAGGHFINFNGTAGVWRAACIRDAGGWQADTLTEDLDLSYRAQLGGWQFRFLKQVGTPAELPVAMDALKSQQFRWTKGAAECARKNLGQVLRSKQLSVGNKLHALFHLLNSALFICILFLSVLSIPLFFVKVYYPEYNNWFRASALFLFSTVVVTLFFWTAYQDQRDISVKQIGLFIIKFPIFLAVSMGLALHNGLAVLEGYLGKKTPFIRTPKFNITKQQKGWQRNQYLQRKIHPLVFVELALMGLFAGASALAFYYQDFSLFPFHSLLALGYGLVSYYSLRHYWLSR